MKFKTILKQSMCAGVLTCFMGSAQAVEFAVSVAFDGADANPGDGVCATVGGNCTLRAAVMETNELSGADSISIAAGTYSLALGSTGEDLAAEGDLDILDDLTITGDSASTTTVNGNSFMFRIFEIHKRSDDSLPVVSINKLSITQGTSLITNVGKLTLDDVTLTEGGSASSAVVNSGDITLINSRITDNYRALFSSVGSVDIINSYFNNNIVIPVNGAALYLSSGEATIKGSVFSDNQGRDGAAIYSKGTLTIDDCQFTGNKGGRYREADPDGAAIYQTDGVLKISNSTFENNVIGSYGRGGAVFIYNSFAEIVDSTFNNNSANMGGGMLTYDLHDGSVIKRVTFNSNQANYGGGGIFINYRYNGPNTTIFSDSLLINNTASGTGGGLGISLKGDVTLQNSTISGNTANISGGGVYHSIDSTANPNEFYHVTLANNISPVGAAGNITTGGVLRIYNTLIANPVGGTDCAGTLTSFGYNLSSDDSCGFVLEGDQANTDPMLSALADNGGINKTIALQDGSPAINAGNSVLCADLNPIDQRYYYRSDAVCDVGAYEANSSLAQTGTLGFSTANYSVNETDAMATITLSRSGGSEGNVSVPFYDSLSGSATEGAGTSEDYVSIASSRLEWLDGDSSDKTVDITINDDSTLEGDETIQLAIGGDIQVYGGASLGVDAATVTVIDDDLPGEVKFNSSSYSEDEDGNFVVIFVDRVNGNTAVSIDYSTSDDTAIAGTDYTATNGSLDFAIGQTSSSFNVFITNNDQLDGDRTVILTLSNPQGGVVLTSPDTVILTILDDEVVQPGEISIETDHYTASEDGGSLSFNLVRTGGTDGEVSVDIALVDGTATLGSDFSASLSATFLDGESTISNTITIIDDTEYEVPFENFSISISNPQGGAALGLNTTANVEIVDNDDAPVDPEPGVISIEIDQYMVNEDSGTLSFNVIRTGGTDGEVSVDVALQNGSATFGEDYSDSSQAFTITFADGESSKAHAVSIIDDTVDENVEDFSITLSNAQGGALLGTNTIASVEINDNDDTPVNVEPGVVSFEQGSYSVAEDSGMLSFNVIRAGGSDGVVSVDITLFDDSAEFATDFETATQTFNVTFADGESTRNLDITIIDDTEIEADEVFTMLMDNVQGGATLGLETVADVKITDNDSSSSNSGKIDFMLPSMSISEGDGVLTYLLVRAFGTDGSVSVDISLQNAEAIFGQDYSANEQTTTIVFADGESQATGTVTIVDDSDIENDETFNLVMSNPQGGATTGFRTTIPVTITDNDSGTSGNDDSTDDSGGAGSFSITFLMSLFLMSLVGRRRKYQHG